MPSAPLAVPPLGNAIARRGNAFSRALSTTAMRMTGWRFEGGFPDLPQFVIIVAPHTSNWDFLVGVMAMFALGFRGTFLGKHTLFRWPLRGIMRWLGGVPVDRASPHKVVEQVVEYFHTRPQLVLALSPEGTRKKLPAWRTGFWYVAKGAGVPIVPVAFDYPAHCIRIHAPVTPTDDAGADIERLGRLFDARMARYPERY
jgi:1-acyl-sn-glycerol-3-phosphate acyltransferase